MAEPRNLKKNYKNEDSIILESSPVISTGDNSMPLTGPMKVNVWNGVMNDGNGWGLYIFKIKIEVFSDNNATDLVYESTEQDVLPSLILSWNNGESELVRYGLGETLPDQRKYEMHSFEIPKNKLKSNTTYYWRATSIEKSTKGNKHSSTNIWGKTTTTYNLIWGQTYTYTNWTATNLIHTVDLAEYAHAKVWICSSDVESVDELTPEVSTLPAEGGLVKIFWTGGHNATAVKFDSNPIISGLPSGEVSIDNIDAGIQLNIFKSTTINMIVTNDSAGGEFVVPKEITLLPVPSITIDWTSSELFSLKTDMIGDNYSVVRAGGKYNIDIYTEFMSTAGVYLYYPLLSNLADGTTNTETVLATSNILRELDLIDMDTISVPIEIKPPTLRPLPIYYAISGAYGVEGVGKDKIRRRKLMGKFMLIKSDETNIDTTAPVITSFSPMEGYVNDIITINGKNFGNLTNDNIINGYDYVQFGEKQVNILDYEKWSNTQIMVRIPPGLNEGYYSIYVTMDPNRDMGKSGTSGTSGVSGTSGTSGTITLRTAVSKIPINILSTTSTDPLAPIIESFSPTSGNPGDIVTIKGKRFGNKYEPVSNYPDKIYVKFGDMYAVVDGTTNSPDWTDTQVKVKIPYTSTGGEMNISMNVNYKHTVSSNKFNILPVQQKDAQIINSITPTGIKLKNMDSWPNTLVTVEGRNFGNVQGNSIIQFSRYDRSPIMTPISWSDTKITFTLPVTINVAPDSYESYGVITIISGRQVYASSYFSIERKG